jgi:hypothetical protein
MHSKILQALRMFRRRVLPPSAADIARRFNHLAGRMESLEAALRHQRQLPSFSAQQDEVLSVLRLIMPKCCSGPQKIRVGSANDGGYIMLDDFAELSCALSFGISDNDSWDLAVAERGVHVYQFDHSVEQAPSSHQYLKFFKTRISTRQSHGSETLPELIKLYSRKKSSDILLKMDIEGDEWEVLNDCPGSILKHCTQIICEFHNLHRLGEAAFLSIAREVFMKLSNNFIVVHIHANNCGQLFNIANIALPDVIEITFVNNDRYIAKDGIELFPTALDMANLPSSPDIYLGAFRF